MAGVSEFTEIMVDGQDGNPVNVTDYVTGIEGFQNDFEKIETDITPLSSVGEDFATVGFRIGGAMSYVKVPAAEDVFAEGNIINGVPVDVERTVKLTKRVKGGAIRTYTGEFTMRNNASTSERSDGAQRGRAEFRWANEQTAVPKWVSA